MIHSEVFAAVHGLAVDVAFTMGAFDNALFARAVFAAPYVTAVATTLEHIAFAVTVLGTHHDVAVICAFSAIRGFVHVHARTTAFNGA